ncbi:MAG: hypothetical protein DRP29_06615 [Thermodesulfobacteriota bacterium]|nr:MAG: hypothetical protein DRP29_06615 [Thermodesulfobacteriota bacterium]
MHPDIKKRGFLLLLRKIKINQKLTENLYTVNIGSVEKNEDENKNKNENEKGGGKMKRKEIVCLIFVWLLLIPSLSYSGEIDILVEKLVDKGILSLGEARAILIETKEEIRKNLAKGKLEILPKWIQNTKIKGDLRLRYQWEDKHDAPDRHRGRYRFRLGLETKVNRTIKMSAGLATGGDDARSTNQTMCDGFSTPDIRLDYAYVEWMATSWLVLKAGKIKSIKKLIFRPSDLLWDSDINPEGISCLLSKKRNNYDLFMNVGFWILDEEKEAVDPYMWIVQPGIEYKFGKNAHLKLALAGYSFDNVKGATLTNGKNNSGKYNTLEGGVLKYNYNSISPSIEIGFKKPFGGLIPYLTVFGDYVNNPDPSENNNGYLFGIKFGDKKVKRGKWQVKYMYRYLEKDAWIDIFPDSDAYSGHTDVKGHEFAFTYGVGKNVTLGIDYYYMERIKGIGRKHLLQLDWKIKF